MSKRGFAAPLWKRGWLQHGFVVAGLLLLATGLDFLLDAHLSLTSKAMVYVLAVVAASSVTSLGAAMVCSVASALLLGFFFTPPRFDFAVESEHVLAIAVMVVIAFVITQRGGALRREARLARLHETRARLLQDLATELASVAAPAEIEHIGRRFLLRALEGAPAAQVEEALRSCMAGGEVDPGDDDGLAHAVCTQLAQALSRLRLTASVRAAQERAQWHRVQGTFLAGISHEFRTPLEAMGTAASSLHEQRAKLGAHEQQRLAGIILQSAAQLATLTDNTLQLARLENAGEIQRDWQSIEEIVGSVLARLRERDASGRIRPAVPGDLPLIQGDPGLLAQLLVNLLTHALGRGSGPIALAVSAREDWIEVSVRGDQDGGPATRRGAGVELAVCRAIAHAHGGELLAHDGAVFVLRLPVQPVQLSAEPA